ncbi:MAG: transporter substrate-binding domain-containing protein [Psychrosphaera sp.]|nr:transporter substrate-binding domain-containing protein [Psychrosphaera sp.]
MKVLCVLCMVALFVTTTAQASHIKVVTEYLAPFQIKNPDGSLGGYSTEVVRALFKLTGDTPNIQVLPWSRGYRIAQSDKNVMIYSIARTQQREPLFHWLGKLKDERIFVWGLKTKFSQPFCSVDEFKHYVFASSKNYNTGQFLTLHDFKTVQSVNQNEQVVKMLFRSRADLIVGNELVLENQAELVGLDFSKTIKLFEAKSLAKSLSIAFSKSTDPAVLKRFKTAFARLEASGQLAAIKKRWDVVDDSQGKDLSPYTKSGRKCE